MMCVLENHEIGLAWQIAIYGPPWQLVNQKVRLSMSQLVWGRLYPLAMRLKSEKIPPVVTASYSSMI